MPADGIAAAIRPERRRRHVPSRRADFSGNYTIRRSSKRLISPQVAENSTKTIDPKVRVWSFSTARTGPWRGCPVNDHLPDTPPIFHQFQRRTAPLTSSIRDRLRIHRRFFVGCATGGWLAVKLRGASKWRSCVVEFVLAALDQSRLMDWMLGQNADWRGNTAPDRYGPEMHSDPLGVANPVRCRILLVLFRRLA